MIKTYWSEIGGILHSLIRKCTYTDQHYSTFDGASVGARTCICDL